MNAKKFSIPVQPKFVEVRPGEYDIDKDELTKYYNDMNAAHNHYKQVILGAENDPDEIMRRLIGMLK